jgi:hypothetical protein
MPSKGDTPDSLQGVPGRYPGGPGGVRRGKIGKNGYFWLFWNPCSGVPGVLRGSLGGPWGSPSPLCLVMGASWTVPGRYLDGTQEVQEGSGGVKWSFLAIFGHFWPFLGPPLRVPGGPKGVPGGPWGPHSQICLVKGALQTVPKGSQKGPRGVQEAKMG